MSNQTYKYKSTIVAKYILSKAQEGKIVMNMTKLQKLLYISYGIYLAVKDERLTDESPKAWPYGPVFPTTRNILLKVDFQNFDINKDDECKEICNDLEIKSLIELTLSNFGAWSAGQLTEWSHSEGSPWDLTKQRENFDWNQPIPDEYIKIYFSKILKEK
jgi:uncharacterized phage-associated protein